jgi:Regulator of G protein signaling domain
MISRNHDPPSSQYLHTPSPDSSPRGSIFSTEGDADAVLEAMDTSGVDVPEYGPLAGPLGVPIARSQASLQPSGPYCPPIPTLQEILTNRSPPPWTLAAFTAYLAQNHCLENLQFIKAAERYRKQHIAIAEELMAKPPRPESTAARALRAQWLQLLDAYVRPNAPREVNLPANVRDALLIMPIDAAPPNPSILDPAIQRILELMNESILLSFISEHAPQRPASTGPEDPEERLARRSGESGRMRSQSQRKHSPVGDFVSRAAHATSRSAPFGSSTRPPMNLYGGSAISGDTNSMEDTFSSGSPTNSPMTPPTTPPSSDLGGGGSSPRQRPHGWRHLFSKQGGSRRRLGSD